MLGHRTALDPRYKRGRCDPRFSAPSLRHAPLTERKESKLESASSDATTAGASGCRNSNSVRSHHPLEGRHRQHSDRFPSRGRYSPAWMCLLATVCAN